MIPENREFSGKKGVACCLEEEKKNVSIQTVLR